MLRSLLMPAVVLPALTLVAPAVAMPMSGTFDTHVGKQDVRPLGSPDRLEIQQTGSGINRSPGLPLDGAAVGISEIAVLKRGNGPVQGTITFNTPVGSTVGTYSGRVSTDAQGRVTAQGRFRTRDANGAFAGLKGGGTFSTVFTSKTDAITQWSGEFTPPTAQLSSR
ncbi:hypothetical protein [Methylobacterium dankookense]|uniref:DUF3224 domain-containing protein n=1 Tax=Methylobacterium dankookense TaxID=560405 RepID=A0A564FSM1_9HYPH|nr:hypothetical protein [Methylobacterium dankookense]GJD58397.1 hypothetical protein IFDJLNFL_4316 [Methylobacterium dankookense]VUF11149.1 hypothetical protein MTDSW087_00822 [Methylobacterium dankookense]